MTTIVQEGIEPMLIGTHLLQRIQYKPGMTTVFPAIEPCRQRKPGTAFSADLQQQHWRYTELRCSRDSVSDYDRREPCDLWMRSRIPGYIVLGHHNSSRAGARRWASRAGITGRHTPGITGGDTSVAR